MIIGRKNHGPRQLFMDANVGGVSTNEGKCKYLMSINGFNRRFLGIAMSVCLALIVTNASGAVSQKSHVPLATKVRWASQGGKKAAPRPAQRQSGKADEDYVIGPSDVLDINVWKDPELTQTVPVRPDGRITLPLIGELQVSGLTAMNVQLIVTNKLKEFVSNPEVTVIVEDVRSRTYIVVGKIAHPGSYDLGKPTTILEGIAIAGGFLDFAKTNKVYVLRRQSDGSSIRLPFDYKKVIDQKSPGQNVELKNGDTIVIP